MNTNNLIKIINKPDKDKIGKDKARRTVYKQRRFCIVACRVAILEQENCTVVKPCLSLPITQN